MRNLQRPLVVLLASITAALLLPSTTALARPGDAWVDLIRGRPVKHRPRGGSGWRALPADTCVKAGDKLRLATGTTVRINYHNGAKRTYRGPRVLTVPRVGKRTAQKRAMNVGGFLKMLVSRYKSYHRVGAGTLSTGGKAPGYIQLLQPRYSVVAANPNVTLTWVRKGAARRYEITVWRFLDNGDEQKLTRSVSCSRARCRWTVPSTFKLRTGVRYHWKVKVKGSGLDAYPAAGIWFQVASPSRVADLNRQLARAKTAPATKRGLLSILAYALYGFHHEALALLARPGQATSSQRKKLRAQLLCLTCRPAAANRIAGRKFCTCRER